MSDSERSHKSEKKRLKKLAAVSVIAKPLAGKKLTKRLLKLAKYGEKSLILISPRVFTSLHQRLQTSS